MKNKIITIIILLLIALLTPNIFPAQSTPLYYEVSIYVPAKIANKVVEADLPKTVETAVMELRYYETSDKKGVTVAAKVSNLTIVKAVQTKVVNYSNLNLIGITPVYTIVPTPTATRTKTP